MPLRQSLVPSLGLLHIMEDVLEVVQGKTIAAERRNYVLRHAREFFEDVEKGEQALQSDGLFINVAHEREVNRLRLYERFTEWVVVLPSVRARSATEVKKALEVLSASGVAGDGRSFAEYMKVFCEWLAILFEQQYTEPEKAIV